jgi:hypothetical protein
LRDQLEQSADNARQELSDVERAGRSESQHYQDTIRELRVRLESQEDGA